MPVTSRTPLGAPTHYRGLWVDVADIGSSAWLPVMGTENTQFNPDAPTVNDVTDNDSGGFKSNSKDAATWSLTTSVFRKTLVSDPTSYDPGQNFVRDHSIGKFGAENTFQARVYEMEPGGPRDEAYLGVVNSSWEPQQGPPDGDVQVNITLNGNGILTKIAHPDTGAEVPIVSAATNSDGSTLATAGGDLVLISGNRLSDDGSLDVKFDTTSATAIYPISDGRILAVAPAHAAGAVDVTVINGAGTSATHGTVTYA